MRRKLDVGSSCCAVFAPGNPKFQEILEYMEWLSDEFLAFDFEHATDLVRALQQLVELELPERMRQFVYASLSVVHPMC